MFGLGILFNVLLYKPLFNSLVLLQNIMPWHDFGLAIIALTLAIKIILHPLSAKAVRSQKAMQKIQPLLLEAQKKYKGDKEAQAREVLNIYKSEKINPFSGILVTLMQLPILIALYQVFWNGLNAGEMANLYSFVAKPAEVNTWFLNVIDLAKPSMIMAILAGITQFFQAKMMLPKLAAKDEKGKSKDGDFSAIMQNQMLYFMPIFTVIILINLPSALGLYWAASGIITIFQQHLIAREPKSIL